MQKLGNVSGQAIAETLFGKLLTSQGELVSRVSFTSFHLLNVLLAACHSSNGEKSAAAKNVRDWKW